MLCHQSKKQLTLAVCVSLELVEELIDNFVYRVQSSRFTNWG